MVESPVVSISNTWLWGIFLGGKYAQRKSVLGDMFCAAAAGGGFWWDKFRLGLQLPHMLKSPGKLTFSVLFYCDFHFGGKSSNKGPPRLLLSHQSMA